MYRLFITGAGPEMGYIYYNRPMGGGYANSMAFQIIPRQKRNTPWSLQTYVSVLWNTRSSMDYLDQSDLSYLPELNKVQAGLRSAKLLEKTVQDT